MLFSFSANHSQVLLSDMAALLMCSNITLITALTFWTIQGPPPRMEESSQKSNSIELL